MEISLDLVIKNFGREQKRGTVSTTKFRSMLTTEFIAAADRT